MSALGQKQTFASQQAMAAFPPEATADQVFLTDFHCVSRCAMSAARF
jgi:hypothetical protein